MGEESNWARYCQDSKQFHRKVERDWNMVYLARNEDETEKQTIEWKFNVPEKSKIDKIEITVNSAEFKTGRVMWTFCAGDFCCMLKSGEKEVIDQMEGSPTELSLKAMLSGKDFWQHSQLFRQKADDHTEMLTLNI